MSDEPADELAGSQDLQTRVNLFELTEAIAEIGSWRTQPGPDAEMWLSAQARRILGVKPDVSFRNVDFFRLIHREDVADVVENILQVRERQVRRSVDFRVRVGGPEGETRILRVVAGPLPDGTGVAGTVQDATVATRLAALGPEEDVSTLVADLEGALASGALSLEFQPIRSLTEGRYVAAEALLRWQHPRRGRRVPDAFVEFAEEAGLIHQLGSFVLSRACAELRRWLDAGVRRDFQVYVNVSPLQLRDEGFLHFLARLIGEVDVPPSSVVLELTESALVGDGVEQLTLEAARDHGVKLAIDDFGTKYSALSYLARLPVDLLKIDRSFVQQLDQRSGRAITAAIVALARELGLDVAAEGVETERQLEVLRELGCQSAQGFLISPALPGPELVALLVAEAQAAP